MEETPAILQTHRRVYQRSPMLTCFPADAVTMVQRCLPPNLQ